MTDVAEARERYAEELRATANVRSPAVVRAFARVPREHFLGPGPWQILDPRASLGFPPPYALTPDASPVHLYRDVLVAIDATRLLNNGQPSAQALWIDALDLRDGDHAVHIGCGTGYYTAIIAEVVGSSGRVTAIEMDGGLAERARTNLAHLPQARVIHGDGCLVDPGPADAVYVNAGATHPLALWLESLSPGGRLLFPLVRWPWDASEGTARGTGVVVKVTRRPQGHAADVVSPVAIFPCPGAVESVADERLRAAFGSGVAVNTVRSLRREPHAQEPTCWLHGDGFCLSTLPLT